jgi:SPP1 gp7 family putative phage head morphogenesis protein
MTNANTAVFDRAVDRAAMVRLYERRVAGKVELLVDGHAVRLERLVREAERSQRGLERLREAVDRELRGTYREVYSVTRRSLLDLASDQLSYAYQTVEAAVGRIWRTARPERRVSEEIVLQRPLYSDRTLAAGWAGVSISERQRIEALIRRGMAEGLSMEEMAREVRRGNVHKITRMHSRALVVTAVTSVRAQADHAVYAANARAIRGWQYVAILDSRTTPLCAHRDGTVYPPEDTEHLPPAHYNCRSTTVPVFKSWADIASLEGVAQVRRNNVRGLTRQQMAYYDGQTPMRESYHDWLSRQTREVQLRHLGEYEKVSLFRSGQLHLSKFTNDEGNSLGIKELRALTDSGYLVPGDTRRFAAAKARLDAMQLGASSPDDFISDDRLARTLVDYYLLQSGDLDGNLSLTNYRGLLLNVKRATKNRVLASPPREDQTVFNPFTRRYDDVRVYQPKPEVLESAMRRVGDSADLLPRDAEFIGKTVAALEDRMGVNERAVVAENLRILFSRYRRNPEPWVSFKAASNAQMKFDVTNVSDYIETQIRKDSDVLRKLQLDAYVDPVLGATSLQELHDGFLGNILAKNLWEDSTAPKIAREMRDIFDYKIPLKIRARLSERDLQQFYLRFAHRLSLADSPDRDSLAVSLGRDLYNMANLNGSRNQWFNLGLRLMEAKKMDKLFSLGTFGVQKRRMKSRMSGKYFGPYYDTLSYYVELRDKRLLEYAALSRRVELGLRVNIVDPKNRLIVRPGYKTYFMDRGVLGLEDTRIPIVSSSSFSEFPESAVDREMADALNWAARAEFRVDRDYYDFVRKLLYFRDDRGAAQRYEDLNTYRKYIASRGDSYERFKAMEWLVDGDKKFSSMPFLDHRARIYERGLVGPQAGETFRPFLNTAEAKAFSPRDFRNFQDQVGSFLGGLSDYFEGRHDSLTFTGRQKIAERWRPELVRLGNHMLRGKPNDIRAVLDSDLVARVDGEELGKFFRLAMETAKLDNFLRGDYTKGALETLSGYRTALALEQDASSSGAQIIALTTRNKQLAELSNVVPTSYKKRLYDEIAAATYNDPRFRRMNERLGLTEKDLRKAAKAQNMVTLYGAGERTGTLNVEGKLSKVLEKDTGTLVVKTSDRDTVLAEISARMARYEKLDPELYEELSQLRKNVKDIFDRGVSPGEDIMEELWFLDSKTRDLVDKMSSAYDRVVTPDDFKQIAAIMSEHLQEQVPVLKNFTRFLGRLAEEFLNEAKPSQAAFDWESIGKIAVLGTRKKGYVLPDRLSEMLGLKAGEPVSEKLLKRLAFWNPQGTLRDIVYGVELPETRRTGATYLKFDFPVPIPDFEKRALGREVGFDGVPVLYANKLPKSWTNVPWVNFDGKVLEQHFTQSFEERLNYRDEAGNWIKNILQVPQKTEATWWEQAINKSGKINDIADTTKARTAFAVNGNHSNDAVLVKRFHLWGRGSGVQTSTVHDAFFTNAADMIKARAALREIYARAMDRNVIRLTLDEMRARGLPKAKYDAYLEEAIELGLIPVPGKSRIGGKLMKDSDILTREDVLREIPDDFFENFGWYGVN